MGSIRQGEHVDFNEENSNWIERDALVQQMGDSPGVIILHAEGGAGKTTLAHQWAIRQGRNSRTAWVACDEHDANLEVVWRKVLNVLKSLNPTRFHSIVRDYANGLLEAEELPSILLTYAIEGTQGFAIVFDDFHYTSSIFQEQMLHIYRSAPSLTIVLTTREPTAFSTRPCLEGAGLRMIHSEDLAFSESETERLVRTLAPLASRTLSNSVRRATNGHILAIRIMAVELGSRPDIDSLSVVHDGMLEASAGGILRYLPRLSEIEEKALAYKSAICPEVTPVLARSLDNSGDSWRHFRKFEELGLGVISRKSGRQNSFRFHALVKAALQSEAVNYLSKEECIQVKATAFSSLRGVADPVDVFRLGLESGEDDALFRYFVTSFVEFSLVRSEECRALLSELDPERVRSSWQISLIWAMLLIENTATAPKRSVILVRNADRVLRSQVPAPGVVWQAYLALARMAIFRIEKKFGALATSSQNFVRCVDQISIGSGEEHVKAWGSALFQAHLSLVLAGRLDDAAEVARKLEDDPVFLRRLRLDSSMAFVHAFNGNSLQSQKRLCDVREGRLPAGWDDSPLAIGAQVAEALWLVTEGKESQGIESLSAAAGRLQQTEMWPAVLWARAKARLFLGDVDRGIHELVDSLAEHSSLPLSSWWAARLRVCLAELYLGAGHAKEARSQIAGLEREPDVRVVQVLFALAAGDLQAAHDLLGPGLAEPVPPMQKGAFLLLRAGIEGKLGHEDLSAKLTRGALDEIGRAGSRFSFMYLPSGMQELLRDLVPELRAYLPPSSAFQFSVFSKCLTSREEEIVSLLASPATLEHIASTLFISRNTLKSHLRSIYRKLGASGRGEAVAAFAARVSSG